MRKLPFKSTGGDTTYPGDDDGKLRFMIFHTCHGLEQGTFTAWWLYWRKLILAMGFHGTVHTDTDTDSKYDDFSDWAATGVDEAVPPLVAWTSTQFENSQSCPTIMAAGTSTDDVLNRLYGTKIRGKPKHGAPTNQYAAGMAGVANCKPSKGAKFAPEGGVFDENIQQYAVGD